MLHYACDCCTELESDCIRIYSNFIIYCDWQLLSVKINNYVRTLCNFDKVCEIAHVLLYKIMQSFLSAVIIIV